MSTRLHPRALCALACAALVAAALGCAGNGDTAAIRLHAEISVQDVATIEITASRLDGQVLFRSGREAAHVDGATGRRSLDASARLPASTDLVFRADALDSAGAVLASALPVQMQTAPAGGSLSVVLIIGLATPNEGNGSDGNLTAVSDHAPLLAAPTVAPAPAFGKSSTLTLAATDADSATDPGETITYATLVRSGKVLLDGHVPPFATLGAQVTVLPLDYDPIVLIVLAVDSRSRATFWTVNLDPSTGAVTTTDNVLGYAHSVAGDHLDLAILLDPSGVIAYGDTGAGALLPDDELVWLGGRVASLNRYPLTVGGALENDLLLRVTLAAGVDRQFVAPAGTVDAFHVTQDEDDPPLAYPSLDDSDRSEYDAGDPMTLFGENLDGASRLYVQSGTRKVSIDFTIVDGAVVATLPSSLATGSYTATLRTFGTRSGQSPPFDVTAVAQPLVIAPQMTTTPPRGSLTFFASGGADQYRFALTQANSGGTVDPLTGAYTAGELGDSVDVVTVTDSANATASAVIQIGAALAIVPGSPATPPRSTIDFTTSGGSGEGVSWGLTSSGSGAHLDPATGAYAAGAAPSSSDTITATDSLGNTATTVVTVTAGLSITPSAAEIAPLGKVGFTAAGGVGATTWLLTSHPSGGTIDPATGAYQAGAAGTVVDVVQATDEVGNTATANVTIGAALAISPTTATVAPRGAQPFDASGGTGAYAFAVTTHPSGGSISMTGAYTAGTTPDVTDVVTLTDSNGASVIATVMVGDGVTLTPAAPSVAPLTAVSFKAAGGSGAGYGFALTSHPSGGTIDPTTGEYRAGAAGDTSDTVQVTDSFGNVATTTVMVGAGIAITPSAPTSAPRGTIAFSAGGGAGAPYAWSITTNASIGATIDPATGAYTAGATGSTSDVVQARDSLGNLATVTVKVSAGVSIDPATTSTPPRGAIPFVASGGSNHGFAWIFVTNGSGGTLDRDSGAYTAGATGTSSDVIRVTDDLGNTTTASISVGGGLMITPLDPPVTPRGTANFTATGGSGVNDTWSITSTPPHGSIDPITGVYTAGSAGNVTDTIAVMDSLGNSATTTAHVGAAVALSPTAAVVPPRGGKTFSASGGTGSGFVFSITSTPLHGAIDASTGAYTAGATPSVSDTIQVADPLGNTATGTVTIGLGVSLSPASPSVAPGGGVAFAASGGNGIYTFSITTAGSGAPSIDPSTGAYTAGALGATSDVVQVVDSLGNAASATVTVTNGVIITPNPVTLAPRATQTFVASGGSGSGYIYSLTGTVHGSLAGNLYTAPASGGVGDTLHVVDSLGNSGDAAITIGPDVSLTPAGATIAPRSTQTFVAAGGSATGFVYSFVGTHQGTLAGAVYTAPAASGVTDTVKVVDSLGNAATTTVTTGAGVTLTPAAVTLAPRASQTFAASGGSGTGFVYSLTGTVHGALAGAVYTAPTTGSVSDTLQVVDSLGNTATATITIGAAVSLSPTTVSVAIGGSQTFTASGGNGVYTFSVNAPAHGAITTGGVYTAGSTFGVSDTVTLVDSLGGSATATVAITPPPVVLTPGSATLAPGGTQTFTASGGSGTGYTFSILPGAHGTLGSTTATTTVYTATAPGSDTVQVVDSLGGAATAAVTITAALSIAPLAASVDPHATRQFTASGGNSASYVFSITSTPAHGTITSAGLYTAGATSGVSDTIQVKDANNKTATTTIATATLVINPNGATINYVTGGLTQQFTATGGNGTYTWSITTSHGGTVGATTGLYTAGSAPALLAPYNDIVTVSDGFTSVSVTVKVQLL